MHWPQVNSMRTTLGVIIGASFVGFIDSLYLTVDHFISLPLPCSLLHGCDIVLHSAYSMVGPIPLAAFGVVFYLFVGFITLYILTSPTPVPQRLINLLMLSGVAGAVMSLGFELFQYFVLHALCQYCALSALCSFVICGCVVFAHLKR